MIGNSVFLQSVQLPNLVIETVTATCSLLFSTIVSARHFSPKDPFGRAPPQVLLGGATFAAPVNGSGSSTVYEKMVHSPELFSTAYRNCCRS